MISRLLLLLMLPAFLGGCNNQPRIYNAPESTALLQRQRAATQNVRAAKTKFAVASVKIRDGSKSHALAANGTAKATASNAAAAKWLTLVIPAVDSLILRVPPELKPDAEALKLKVESLSREIDATTGTLATTTAQMVQTTVHLDAATAHQSAGTAELEEANAAINEINAKLAPDYFEAVQKLAADASDESTRRATAENRVSELERKNWIRKALEALAAIALIVGGILYLTGKLTFTGLRTAKSIADAAR